MKAKRSGFLIIGGLVVILGLVAMASVLSSRHEEPLPVLATLPPFALVEASGETVRRDDLAGSPWVADLVFTHCAGICPRMTAEMGRLERQTTDLPGLRFVSISVDPERDTPEVLSAYAERVGARRDRWLWLTGERDTIWKLASEGFLLPLAEGNPEMGDDDIIHSQYFVLLDGGARIRGVYDVRDSEAMLKLRGDVRRLHDEDENERGST